MEELTGLKGQMQALHRFNQDRCNGIRRLPDDGEALVVSIIQDENLLARTS